jgi:hypothetical protein
MKKVTRIRLVNILNIGCIICVSLFFIQPVQGQAKKKRNKHESTIPQVTQSIIPAYRLSLVSDGNSPYRIVIPGHPSVAESKAAEVLQRYLLKISNAALPIIKATEAKSPFEIIIGQNERLDELSNRININQLKHDGFLIRTDSSRLIIAGGDDKGALYGVYTFLETYLGCRMYTPKATVIPLLTSITLDKIEDKQIPVIDYRDTHYKSTWDKEYIDWHKLDMDERGGHNDWGMWVHTFNELLPPAVFYPQHPEFYAEVKGKRLPTQPCLSNPEVLNIITQNLQRKMAQNPGARYWSVSQNDNRDYCTCERCKWIDQQEGSPSGSIIRFVNQVARQFPDKMISTLAYEYGRHAPTLTRPEKNVNIMLCSIEALRHKPIAEDSASADFVKDLKDWGAVASDIIIWDYVIQFNNLVSPFPNLHVLQPNIQLFAQNGVNALFEQGNREVGGEFSELRGYLLSKLMWNPSINVDSLMNDFLNGYYGAAGPYIRSYIDEMKTALLQSGKPLRIFGGPNEASVSYLTPDLMKRYNVIFDAAEKMVSTQAELLERVRIARLPLQFATLEQAKKNWTGEQGMFLKENGSWMPRNEIRSMIDPFVDLCNRQGVTRVKEWSTSPDEYRSSTYKLLFDGMKEHLAYHKPVTWISPDTSMIPISRRGMLTDGIRGGHDYAYNWLSFQGKDLEIVIDLEESKTVKHIETAYYQLAFWLQIMPKKVEYFTSADGLNFTLASSLDNTLPIDQYGAIQRDFVGEFTPRQARYIKVKAYTIGATPSWHPGAGRMPYMFVDEIVVE